MFFSPGVDFNNLFMRSFYAHRSKKRKKSVKSSVSFLHFCKRAFILQLINRLKSQNKSYYSKEKSSSKARVLFQSKMRSRLKTFHNTFCIYTFKNIDADGPCVWDHLSRRYTKKSLKRLKKSPKETFEEWYQCRERKSFISPFIFSSNKHFFLKIFFFLSSRHYEW